MKNKDQRILLSSIILGLSIIIASYINFIPKRHIKLSETLLFDTFKREVIQIDGEIVFDWSISNE